MTGKLLKESTDYLIGKGFEAPEIGIVLGTGLGKLADEIENPIEAHYNHIPYFPLATVEFHSGKLIYGILEGKKVVVMQGRFHFYEGYDLLDVTYPIRVMEMLGIKKLFISNAAGAINQDFKKGDLMLIEDHINLQGGSPLAFKNVSQFGDRFTDMSEPYDVPMRKSLEKIAEKENISLQKGVYASVVGPQLETKAEYRMLKIIGADAVGMSTVPEVIVANHLKLPVVAVSVLTDECDPDNLKPVNIAEIIAIAGKTEPKMIKLFRELIKVI
ncbi:purine-nucleoside phosphorylase [Arenibacter algicola]|jgi:purine-nucleoside phosphorylase|uniref:Purine nucleoside phosphorylase n=1 Tax=Arenibacter algicola TaxID=616991 RepID=A0A221USM1_9FLAO|nr:MULTISPECIES: purine-nucleoside phosphorylase [Arenibacter]ASO04327.1 purine nucleoside phosphorylase 1 [Arenibacter algicola]MBD3661864.1 purine-nucleoside phosphorylase [Arenibacter algicola]GBF21402.1 purine nucleoside phosphorylase 1 [Arenibacter sp. NBRC 103722]HCO85751.1 purine-nucleoside phosphorylase [Arenibacter sp.]|tara:strand:+ start:4118 stop:4933 length:816 start_codon:yes stop_codon:yes gene_type:complete